MCCGVTLRLPPSGLASVGGLEASGELGEDWEELVFKRVTLTLEREGEEAEQLVNLVGLAILAGKTLDDEEIEFDDDNETLAAFALLDLGRRFPKLKILDLEDFRLVTSLSWGVPVHMLTDDTSLLLNRSLTSTASTLTITRRFPTSLLLRTSPLFPNFESASKVSGSLSKGLMCPTPSAPTTTADDTTTSPLPSPPPPPIATILAFPSSSTSSISSTVYPSLVTKPYERSRRSSSRTGRRSPKSCLGYSRSIAGSENVVRTR
jgi:hypothetical protein